MQHQKKLVRDLVRTKTFTMNPVNRDRRSRLLAQRLVEHPAWQATKKIGLFASRGDEIDTSFLWSENLAKGKTFFYPKVTGLLLEFHEVGSLDDLETSGWDICEPKMSKPGVPELLIVPGIAFDSAGGRVGRGKGFYDRYLAAHPEVATIGIGYDFQVVDAVPSEAHDCRVGGVVTDLRTFP